jgi:hypothetical protein
MDIINLVKEHQAMQLTLKNILFKASLGKGYTKKELRKIIKEIRGVCNAN